jgi:hypothetical protein
MPIFGNVWRNRFQVPPYSEVEATMWLPASARLRMARCSAA